MQLQCFSQDLDDDADINAEEVSVDANELEDYIFDVEEDEKEAEEVQYEGVEDDENGLYSENEDNEIAPSRILRVW